MMGKRPSAKPAPETTVPTDKLEALQSKAAELRDIELEIAEVEEKLTALNKRAWTISNQELPELMMDAGVDKIGLAATGNLPAYDVKMSAFYRANIAASWDEEKRKKAFEYLESVGAADLIKTDIIISLPRDQRKEAASLIKRLEKFSPTVKEAVHGGTLSSWLRERKQDGEEVALDIIGGEVGTTVKLKPRKED